jgi:hypothetical protein
MEFIVVSNSQISIIKSFEWVSFIHSQALIVQDGTLASLLGFLGHTNRHTVGLLWTSDQPVAEASNYTGQHIKIHVPSGIRTCDPSNQAAADLRGHRDWL